MIRKIHLFDNQWCMKSLTKIYFSIIIFFAIKLNRII